VKRVTKRYPMMPVRSEMPANFVRGFVATGLLAALQKEAGAAPADTRATLRRALQGGAALAAGCSAADAWQRGNYSGAVVAAASGAAGVVAIDYLMRKPARTDNGGRNGGKEKA